MFARGNAQDHKGVCVLTRDMGQVSEENFSSKIHCQVDLVFVLTPAPPPKFNVVRIPYRPSEGAW